jgi:hypothetical protein
MAGMNRARKKIFLSGAIFFAGIVKKYFFLFFEFRCFEKCGEKVPDCGRTKGATY